MGPPGPVTGFPLPPLQGQNVLKSVYLQYHTELIMNTLSENGDFLVFSLAVHIDTIWLRRA
jgi:hypothetical protein